MSAIEKLREQMAYDAKHGVPCPPDATRVYQRWYRVSSLAGLALAEHDALREVAQKLVDSMPKCSACGAQAIGLVHLIDCPVPEMTREAPDVSEQLEKLRALLAGRSQGLSKQDAGADGTETTTPEETR